MYDGLDPRHTILTKLCPNVPWWSSSKDMFGMSGVQSIIHAWLVYSLVFYLSIKQDQMILTEETEQKQ
jgi:hypothetical protein